MYFSKKNNCYSLIDENNFVILDEEYINVWFVYMNKEAI